MLGWEEVNRIYVAQSKCFANAEWWALCNNEDILSVGLENRKDGTKYDREVSDFSTIWEKEIQWKRNGCA